MLRAVMISAAWFLAAVALPIASVKLPALYASEASVHV